MGACAGHTCGYCGGAAQLDPSVQALTLRVVEVPAGLEADDRPAGAMGKVGAELQVATLDTPAGIDPLTWRYRDGVRQLWPKSYRFQTSRRSWFVKAMGQDDRGYFRPQGCVLQMASAPDERTHQNAASDLEDAVATAAYARRFNDHQKEHSGGDAMPRIKAAIPVVVEVVSTGYPSLVPTGSICTLTAYPEPEVHKYVFDGRDEFVELPQAFFHYVLFASGGKEFACDLQGMQDDDGDVLLIDTCLLRTKLPTVGDLVSSVASVGATPSTAGASRGDQKLFGTGLGYNTSERFNVLHPQCGPVCKAFDPHRHCSKQKAGMCGTSCACGLGGGGGAPLGPNRAA